MRLAEDVCVSLNLSNGLFTLYSTSTCMTRFSDAVILKHLAEWKHITDAGLRQIQTYNPGVLQAQ